MTVLMSLRTRLALAVIALRVPTDCRDTDVLTPVIEAGVDLVICDGSGDVDADVDFLRALRQQWSGQQLLVGTASGKVAVPAAADVVHLRSPGWRMLPYPRGHEWSLLGRHADEAAVVESPGKDFDYLIIPLSCPTDPLLGAALSHQPPLTADALPWFAQLRREEAARDAGIAGMMAAGVRRIALQADILDDGDAPGRISAMAAALSQSWAADERAEKYRRSALRL